MRVDMSPEGVTSRLRTMGELWLLSQKLMNSNMTLGQAERSGNDRARAIQERIRQVLFHDWDPIGLSGEGLPEDEYDAYIAPVYRILCGSRSPDELVNYLFNTEIHEIGVDADNVERLHTAAKKLLALNVDLTQER